ncbi:MAG: helix-turn-helix domain-containing protein [Myxococcaceae bacterium]|nr:helix-turn-helix domain-containing protein [Myxococcaceae bacterium]
MARPRVMSDEQLEAAAREVFLELGPAAPVADVARRLGVTQAALFHRLGSKEALMLKALCPGAPHALAAFAQTPRTDVTAHQQLAPTLKALLDFLRQAIPGLVILRGAGIALEKALPPGPPPPIAMRAALASFLSMAAEKGLVALDDAAASADAVLGALEARVLNEFLGGRSFIEPDDDDFLARLLDATVPRARPPP